MEEKMKEEEMKKEMEKEEEKGQEVKIEQDVVKDVIERARKRIEVAVQKTADRLRDASRRRSSADIASLFRQPSRAALELAKAAEVYEVALEEVTKILRQRQGLSIDGAYDETDRFAGETDNDSNTVNTLGVQLTTDQLAILSQLSGCQQSLTVDPCTRHLCFHLKYRSIDGRCNNLNNHKWGAALNPFYRLLSPEYENGVNTPIGWNADRSYFGFPKPSARLVSIRLLANSTMRDSYKPKYVLVSSH
ncbi:hypothetical protein Ciccas_008366 [Cichlidogyrus casuarinus]|uniref:Uncharacterized protein n=1 Tax=Cichlidogyrus casuarinus TaxID=1844966 RepID=A0ABD2Q048_9PLAT